VLHVDRACGDEGVDAETPGRLQRFAGGIYVLETCAAEAADDGILGARGDSIDGFEIAGRRNRETGFDDVDAHRIEKFGDFYFFFERHRGSGRLFAVAQCGVENSNPV
jgi:hypothetical protein